MIWKLKVALQNALITLNNTDNMNKKLLKSREDFVEWKKYCENVVYDRDSVKFKGEEEDEPKEYPCVMISHDEREFGWGSYLYTLHYCFIYSSDIVA